MRDALDFADKNGFEVSLTNRHHVQFKGHGVIVIGSSSPRNNYAGKQAVSRMRQALRESGAQPATD